MTSSKNSCNYIYTNPHLLTFVYMYVFKQVILIANLVTLDLLLQVRQVDRSDVITAQFGFGRIEKLAPLLERALELRLQRHRSVETLCALRSLREETRNALYSM